MANLVVMIAICTVSTWALADGYTNCGQRKDTTTMNTSEFPLFFRYASTLIFSTAPTLHVSRSLALNTS